MIYSINQQEINMKKYNRFLIFSLVTGFILAAPLMARATPVGNTASVDTLHGQGAFSLKETRNISIDTSFDTDFIFARDLSARDATNAKIENSEWYMTKIGCRIFDRFEPYASLGGAHLKAKWTGNGSTTSTEMDTSTGFAWGLGLKALIYEFMGPKIKIIGDGSYRTTDLNPYKGYLDGQATSIDKLSSSFVLREWQASILASGEIELGPLTSLNALNGYKLSPYGGIKYSQVNGRIRLTTTDGSVYHPDEIESRRNVGIVTGFDITAPGDNLSFNLEGRFIDEDALSAGLSLLF